MGFIKSLFNPPKIHWTFGIFRDGKPLYLMHGNSLMRIVGYCLPFFSNGAEPVAPWALYLRSNHTDKGFWLRASHVNQAGDNVTQLFYDQLALIDPFWSDRPMGTAEPICRENGPHGKRIKITPDRIDFNDPHWLEKMAEGNKRPPEITFHSVLREAFGIKRA